MSVIHVFNAGFIQSIGGGKNETFQSAAIDVAVYNKFILEVAAAAMVKGAFHSITIFEDNYILGIFEPTLGTVAGVPNGGWSKLVPARDINVTTIEDFRTQVELIINPG